MKNDTETPFSQGGKTRGKPPKDDIHSFLPALAVVTELFREPLEKVVPRLGKVLPKHKIYQEGDVYANAKDVAKQEEVDKSLTEIDEEKTAIKAVVPEKRYAERHSFSDLLVNCVIIAALVGVPGVSVMTLQDLIQSNSDHGLEFASFGIAVSVWVFAAGIDAAVSGALKPFKWAFELLAVVLLLYWAPIAIDAVAGDYGVSHASENSDDVFLTPQWDDEEPLVEEAEDEESVEESSPYLEALIMGEGCCVFLLVSWLRRRLLPQLLPIRKAAERDIEALSRKEWLVKLSMGRRKARIAASEHRKEKAEAPSKFAEELFKQLKK